VTKYKWLTTKEVREYLDAGAYDRFAPDWLAMRSLFERLIVVRSVDELPEAAEVWSDVVDMLEATSDD